MQKISAANTMILTQKSNIMKMLRACRKIVHVQKFKKLIIFKINFEERNKVLKSNEF